MNWAQNFVNFYLYSLCSEYEKLVVLASFSSYWKAGFCNFLTKKFIRSQKTPAYFYWE